MRQLAHADIVLLRGTKNVLSNAKQKLVFGRVGLRRVVDSVSISGRQLDQAVPHTYTLNALANLSVQQPGAAQPEQYAGGIAARPAGYAVGTYTTICPKRQVEGIIDNTAVALQRFV